MPIIKTDKPVQCSECGDTIPPWTPDTDGERPMRGRDGNIRCECCHETYMEQFYPED